MKKEALINIIVNDLKEVQELMEAFRGETSVSNAFINLAKTKVKNIGDEISLLALEFGDGKVKTETAPAIEEKVISVNEEPAVSKNEDKGLIMESAKRSFPEEVPQENKNVETAEEKKSSVEKVPVNEEVKPEVQKRPGAGKPVSSEKDAGTKKSVEKEEKKTGKKSKDESHTILADTLKKDKKAVNERDSLKETENDLIFAKPVNDVRKAMGINDRFYFQRELFDGNAGLFNQTLNQLNSMKSFDDAAHFLKSNFEWDTENDAVNSFFKAVKRRFL